MLLWPHFHHDIHFYKTNLGHISFDEEMMKEDLHSWFQGLGYVEGFGPSEVLSSDIRKKQIYTYVIVSAAGHI